MDDLVLDHGLVRGVGASALVALEGLLVRVEALVDPQRLRSIEALAALLARERLLTGVGEHVVTQVARIAEYLPTFGAHVPRVSGLNRAESISLMRRYVHPSQ